MITRTPSNEKQRVNKENNREGPEAPQT